MRAALIATLVGCYSPRVTPGVACTSACPGEQECVDGFCRDPGFASDAAAVDTMIDGSPNVDTDGDGKVDSDDNCIAVANADQHDEDSDNLGDVCDPCPHIAIGGATDTDTDGVGDACDPAPAIPKQHWLVFDPLTTRAAAWTNLVDTTFGTDAMTIDDGGIRYARTVTNVRVQFGGDLMIKTPAVGHQMVLEFSQSDDSHYYYAELYSEATVGEVKLTRRDAADFPTVDSEPYASLPQGAFAWTLDISVGGQTLDLAAKHGATQFPALSGAAVTGSPIIASPNLLIGVSNIVLRVDYFALIETL